MPVDKDKKIRPRDVAKRVKAAKKVSKGKVDMVSVAKKLGKKAGSSKSKKTTPHDWYAAAKKRFSLSPKRSGE